MHRAVSLGLLAGGTIGENSFEDTSQAASGGVDLRWKPARKTIYKGLRLNFEYTWADRKGVPGRST